MKVVTDVKLENGKILIDTNELCGDEIFVVTIGSLEYKIVFDAEGWDKMVEQIKKQFNDLGITNVIFVPPGVSIAAI